MSYIDMVGNLNQEFDIEFPQELYGVVGTVNGFSKEILGILKEKGLLESLVNGKKGRKGKKKRKKQSKGEQK